MASSLWKRPMNILVTGSNGFIGKNLIAWLERRPDVQVLEFDQEHSLQELDERLAMADLVYHLAGVNRPQSVEEFRTGNVDLTAYLCDRLVQGGRPVSIVLSSSIQAALDNPYGVSKRQAEEVVAGYAQQNSARVLIYRLHNVFGKWCRPNYNSVVATFCHNIAHDLPITISDPAREVELVHVDDVVEAFVTEIREQQPESQGCGVSGGDADVSSVPGAVGSLDPVISADHGGRCRCPTSPTSSPASCTAPTFPTWRRMTSHTTWRSAAIPAAAWPNL